MPTVSKAAGGPAPRQGWRLAAACLRPAFRAARPARPRSNPDCALPRPSRSSASWWSVSSLVLQCASYHALGTFGPWPKLAHAPKHLPRALRADAVRALASGIFVDRAGQLSAGTRGRRRMVVAHRRSGCGPQPTGTHLDHPAAARSPCLVVGRDAADPVAPSHRIRIGLRAAAETGTALSLHLHPRPAGAGSS